MEKIMNVLNDLKLIRKQYAHIPESKQIILDVIAVIEKQLQEAVAEAKRKHRTAEKKEISA
jgi:hypothetical protein